MCVDEIDPMSGQLIAQPPGHRTVQPGSAVQHFCGKPFVCEFIGQGARPVETDKKEVEPVFQPARQVCSQNLGPGPIKTVQHVSNDRAVLGHVPSMSAGRPA